MDSAVVINSHVSDKVSHLERHIKFLTVSEGWELSVNVVSHEGSIVEGSSAFIHTWLLAEFISSRAFGLRVCF